MSGKDEFDMHKLEKELEAALENLGDEVKEVEKVKDKKKGEIAEEGFRAAEAVEEGFGNINQMIYERLDINRACLMILLVLILILIFKEDIMKTSFVKNLLK